MKHIREYIADIEFERKKQNPNLDFLIEMMKSSVIKLEA